MNLSESVFQWAIRCLESSPKKRVILGLNGPQGIGKTTLSQSLEALGQQRNAPVFSFSIDDFYLTNKDQNKLAQQYEKSSFLQRRGYPGTHDIDLGVKVLKELSQHEGDVLVPQYNKSAAAGRGDRRPVEKWRTCGVENEILIFEGWMLGFLQKDKTSKELELANIFLKDYEHWWKFLDGFIQLKIDDFNWVVDWRVEAEENMKKEGKAGLTTSEVTGYANQFLPAYNEFSNTLGEFAETFESSVIFEVNKERQCIGEITPE